MSKHSDRGITPDAQPAPDRRSADRTGDDMNWESKVVGRLNGRLRQLPTPEGKEEQSGLGWESSVLDLLRKRIERGPE